MPNTCWLQLLSREDLRVFFVIYDSELNMLKFRLLAGQNKTFEEVMLGCSAFFLHL